jgi:hypothetical protein
MIFPRKTWVHEAPMREKVKAAFLKHKCLTAEELADIVGRYGNDAIQTARASGINIVIIGFVCVEKNYKRRIYALGD